ncbi:hypothetical protein MTR_7g028535 [Medicago truncatula]|uniref:Uncharacterized protein n=1 Tax=Medicago truncatula TaxID=3880 RepID=A0A072TWU8_MEDTR|nr:hypothetical protein MTR_7g028535 [Medicago truncatula]
MQRQRYHLDNATTTTYSCMWYQPGHQAPNLIEQIGSQGIKPSTLDDQTKATEKLKQLSTTFMFTPKVNSNQKRVKKIQEHETGDAVTVQLSGINPFFTPKSQF